MPVVWVWLFITFSGGEKNVVYRYYLCCWNYGYGYRFFIVDG